MYLNTGFSSYKFREEIKDRMKDRKMTQAELAEILQCSRKHLNEILNDHSEMQLLTAISLCSIFNIGSTEFYHLMGA